MHAPTSSATAWRKSRHSGSGNNCVEVADLVGVIGVRDSKNPGGGHLRLSRAALRAFVDEVKAGRHDL